MTFGTSPSAPSGQRRRAAWAARLLMLGLPSWQTLSCATAGNNWLNQRPQHPEGSAALLGLPEQHQPAALPARRVEVIGSDTPEHSPEAVLARTEVAKVSGQTLGSFRNTYYDFPSEHSFSGPPIGLFDRQCGLIKQVPQGFHDTLCVQGSGLLDNGVTVSFARRDCSCATLCPKTGQQICFDKLGADKFPWGRGAAGLPITPLLSVAADTNIIPLHSAVYVPEYDGLPKDPERRAFHDGCFLVQDRGLRVKGQHIDIFTGDPLITAFYNRLVPSNAGVTVIVDSARCQRDPESH